jgi:hypothetical protein
MTDDQVDRISALAAEITTAADNAAAHARLRGELVEVTIIRERSRELLSVLDTVVPAPRQPV